MTTTQRLSATSAEQLRLDALGRELSVDEIYRDPLSVRVPLVAWRALRVNVHSLVAASTARVTLAPRGHVACCPSCAKTHVAGLVRCSLSRGACCIALFQTAKKSRVWNTDAWGAGGWHLSCYAHRNDAAASQPKEQPMIKFKPFFSVTLACAALAISPLACTANIDDPKVDQSPADDDDDDAESEDDGVMDEECLTPCDESRTTCVGTCDDDGCRATCETEYEDCVTDC